MQHVRNRLWWKEAGSACMKGTFWDFLKACGMHAILKNVLKLKITTYICWKGSNNSRVGESERISPGARSPAGAWKGCLTATTFISASREWKLLPNQKRLGNACDNSLVIYFFSSLRNPQYSYYSFLANPSVLPLSTHGLNTSKTPAFVLSVSFQLPAQPIRERCASWGFWT